MAVNIKMYFSGDTRSLEANDLWNGTLGWKGLSGYAEFGEGIAYWSFTELQENVNAQNFI